MVVKVPRTRNPDVAMSLIEAAARVLAEEGRPAVTARRLAAEAGTSTMAVYTHFGSMDELLVRTCQEGFARFGAALEEPGLTDDPVADWMTQGWAYRRFALDDPHLYRVMFTDGLAALRSDDPAQMETFLSLLRRIQRCVDAGRLVVADVHLAGEAVWASVHGHMMIELTGYFDAVGRDPQRAYAEAMRVLTLGYGDQPDALADSMRAAWRRSRRLRAA
jgi:AcrR family transcriptional regulator